MATRQAQTFLANARVHRSPIAKNLVKTANQCWGILARVATSMAIATKSNCFRVPVWPRFKQEVGPTDLGQCDIEILYASVIALLRPGPENGRQTLSFAQRY